MRFAIGWLLFRLRFGAPRPCGDDECVASSLPEHGIYDREEWYRE
jgi:hypothetical protein